MLRKKLRGVGKEGGNERKEEGRQREGGERRRGEEERGRMTERRDCKSFKLFERKEMYTY